MATPPEFVEEQWKKWSEANPSNKFEHIDEANMKEILIKDLTYASQMDVREYTLYQKWCEVKERHVEPAVQTEEVMLPKFVMHLQRPNRTRFEIKSKAASFTRIFDGGHGWREHNGKDGRPVVTPFSKSETDYAKDDQVIDGLLLDAASKGVKVSLDGLDTIEGQRAYRLSLKLSSGAERKAWVDVKTNLDIRYDRPSGTGTDPNRPVPTFYREWSAEDGLVMPHVIETGIAQASPSGVELPRRDRVVIEHVIINPVLDASTFAMPASPMRRNTKQQIHIDTGAPNITPLSR